MGKDYIETIPRQVKDAELASDSIDHTAIADSFITLNSGDPAASNDTGEGYVLGSLWVNTTSGDQFICTVTTAEDAVWINQEGDNINVFLYQATTTVGKTGGHQDGSGVTDSNYQSLTIETIPISSDGNSTDMGEMSPTLGVKGHSTACAKDASPASYVYWHGIQNTSPGDAHVDEMTRHAVSSPATLADIGEENNAHATGGQGQSKSHWFTWAGGGGSPSTTGDIRGTHVKQIEKTTFASPATTADSGGEITKEAQLQASFTDLDGAKCWLTGGQDFSLGPPSPYLEAIESFPTAISSGTVTDEAEMSSSLARTAGANSATHWYLMGKYPASDNIWKGSFTAPETDSDIGEVTVSHYESRCSSGDVSGYRWGGYTTPGGNSIDSVDKFSFTSDANATDVGEMTEVASRPGGWQD